MNAAASAGMGALGGAAVLGVALLSGGLRGPAGPVGEAGASRHAGPPGPAAEAGAAAAGPTAPVVLVRETGSCPEGTTEAGEVRLLTSPSYALAPGQTQTNPGVFTSSTQGWSDVNFFLCLEGMP
jgi:hypothetical protein